MDWVLNPQWNHKNKRLGQHSSYISYYCLNTCWERMSRLKPLLCGSRSHPELIRDNRFIHLSETAVQWAQGRQNLSFLKGQKRLWLTQCCRYKGTSVMETMVCVHIYIYPMSPSKERSCSWNMTSLDSDNVAVNRALHHQYLPLVRDQIHSLILFWSCDSFGAPIYEVSESEELCWKLVLKTST